MLNLKKQKGFSLIEILVVTSIAIFITANLLSNVLRSRLNIIEVAKIVIGDIRTAQANALAAKQYNGTHRCGYGVAPSNGRSYFIYASNPTNSGNPNACSGNWKYNPIQDTPIIFTRVLDSRLEILDPNGSPKPDFFEDITFEPYNGQIHINNQHNPINDNQNLSQIIIRKIGVACPSKNCVYVCVYSFGRISMRTDSACPLCGGSDDITPPACQQW